MWKPQGFDNDGLERTDGRTDGRTDSAEIVLWISNRPPQNSRRQRRTETIARDDDAWQVEEDPKYCG